MSGRKDVGLVITAYVGGTILVFLVIVFWAYFLVAGLIGLVIWLVWSWTSGWRAAARIQHQTGRAIRQNHAAYQRARVRMERIARLHRGEW